MLTPEEIQSREFLVSLRGYDRDEVHAFLGRVAEQLAQTEAKASQLQQRLDRLKAQQPSTGSVAEAAPAAAASSPEPSAMFAEIGKETQRILEAAQEAGQQIQRKARQEADRDLQGARGQAAKLIAEGERRREHIERIVSELEQSRAAMSVQLRGVGRTIEQTLRELAPEDQGGSGGGSSTVREAIGSQAGEPTPASTSPSRAASAAAPAPAQADESAAAAPAAAEPAPEPEPEPELEPEAAAPDDDAEASPAVEDEPPAPAAVEAAAGAAEEESADEPAAAVLAAGEDGGAAQAAAAEPELAPDEGAAEVPAAPAPAATGDNEPALQAAPTRPAARAGVAEPAMAPSRDSEDDEQPDAQALRAAALSPLHPKLVRKVKRELQEIQNIALDKVRRAKGQGTVEDFLPLEGDTEGLGEGAGDLLRQAFDAGVTSAAALAEADLDGGGEMPDLSGTFAADASERVTGGLSSTLRMGLSADEGQQALSDRIGAVFAEFKGAQAEELAATHLIRAYEFGLLGAWSNGGISARRWVMGREPRCPEAKCRSNDQAGAVGVGESFPSGHEVPPVHVGCTCTTVPDSSS